MNAEEFNSLPVPVALIVDDEPLIRMDTADIVSDAGFHVLEAKTADEAYEFLKQHNSLKLLFTDVQMPGDMDGIELARYVGEHWPQISVIVASGAVRPAEGVLPHNARFIPKPISAQLVHDALVEICG
jgi:CheY-like chemotaxis protein